MPGIPLPPEFIITRSETWLTRICVIFSDFIWAVIKLHLYVNN
jgi:hypothetical protein